MNSKDREYMENLNNSLANLSEKIARLRLTVVEFGDKIAGFAEKIDGLSETPAYMKSEPYDYDPITGRDIPATIPPKHESSIENFAMSGSTPSKMKQIKKEISVSTNQFVDDGSMHRDSANQTPDIKVSAKGTRKRFQMIDQICSRCSKTFEVHPQHARDSFTCDNCLRR